MLYDKIILGAGLYGLYAALYCAKRGQRVLVLEYEEAAFNRASSNNQARVHMGYHYPRSYSTAIKAAGYFNRFNKDYGFCIHTKFDQVYATSSNFSWSNAKEFQKFCNAAHIRCEEVSPLKYFNRGFCDGAFLTEEYTYDAQLLKNHFIEQLKQYSNATILFASRISKLCKESKTFRILVNQKGDNHEFETPFVLNATYASVNQIQNLLDYELFKIKYELCEIIMCNVNDNLHGIGLTVMDGPFFSIMPFGKTQYHSLTAVSFTPHVVCKESLPRFDCQKRSEGFCSSNQLGNCNDCIAKPESAWPYMSHLARKYMRDDLSFEYSHSLFSMKPILLASEIDDSRPTVVRTFSEAPTFASVLSGKINTIYDLDELLSK